MFLGIFIGIIKKVLWLWLRSKSFHKALREAIKQQNFELTKFKIETETH